MDTFHASLPEESGPEEETPTFGSVLWFIIVCPSFAINFWRTFVLVIFYRNAEEVARWQLCSESPKRVPPKITK